MSFTAPCVGMRFRSPEEKSIADALLPGDPLTFEREPENQYDSNAVKVLYESNHIGYIAREEASFLATYMDEGRSFTAKLEHRERAALVLEVTEVDAD